MKIEYRTFAVAGVAVGLGLFGAGPGSAARRHIIHMPVSRRIIRPVVRPARVVHVAPPVVVGASAVRHPHLDAALHALLLADAVMHSSTRPDVPRVLRGLTFASVEMKRAPPKFLGHRARALQDIEGAVKALGQRPPSGAAVTLTEQAIQQVRACLAMAR